VKKILKNFNRKINLFIKKLVFKSKFYLCSTTEILCEISAFSRVSDSAKVRIIDEASLKGEKKNAGWPPESFARYFETYARITYVMRHTPIPHASNGYRLEEVPRRRPR